MRRRHLTDEAGYTLFEVILVLVILASAATLALPAADRSRRAAIVKSTAIEIAAAFKAARAEAIRSNQEGAFTIDLGARRFWIEGLQARHALPREVAVGYDVPTAEQHGEGVAKIRFHPDGSSTGGRIRLSGARQAADVTVDWLTGATRIAWRR